MNWKAFINYGTLLSGISLMVLAIMRGFPGYSDVVNWGLNAEWVAGILGASFALANMTEKK